MIVLRSFFIFLFASLVLSLATFGESLWGNTIAAPIDHAPALWKHFKFVDSTSNGIPANHHIVDQLSYDLPLQWMMFQEWRAGRVPWWNPYTYGGRPLLADAHCNGMDPVRLLIYFTVRDFVLAYNWTLIAHHIILSCGVFALLLHLRFTAVIACGVALAIQVGGAFVLYIGHPWITGSFAWYPWLWLAWASAWHRPRFLTTVAAPLLVAAIFYAGNLQSHAYLPVFAAAFIAGYARASVRGWWRGFMITASSGILGALLAAPILGPELELFRLNERIVVERPLHWFNGILALSGVWPWALGTFRSISYQNLGFHLFLGAPAFILAVFGIGADVRSHPALLQAKRCAFFCVLAFLVILSVPSLEKLFYARSGGLAALGLAILCAAGCQRLYQVTEGVARRWAIGTAIWIIALLVGTAGVVWVLYPHFRPRVQAIMDAHLKLDGYEGRSKALRDFQVENFPREVGFANPEVLFAMLSLFILAVVFLRGAGRGWSLAMLLAVNLVSPALFARRFIPRQPLALFERLIQGGPSQTQVADRLNASELRLLEEPNVFDRIFPHELAGIYRVHVAHGYAALQPPSQAWRPDKDPRNVADFKHQNDGSLTPMRTDGLARFQWHNSEPRPIRVRTISLCKVEVSFPPLSDPAEMLRTDTAYPGWKAVGQSDVALDLKRYGETFTLIKIPAGTTQITLTYSPSNLPLCLMGAFLGFAGTIGAALLSWHRNVSGDRLATLPIVPRPS